MGIVGWIVLGLVVGALAKAIMPGEDGGGVLVTMLLGVVGAFVGGLIGNWVFGVGIDRFWSLSTWILALVGSLIVLGAHRGQAIHEVSQGRSYVTPLVTEGLVGSPMRDPGTARGTGRLSMRQREVLQLLAEGHTMKAIARILVSDGKTPGALRPERALTDPKAHAREGQLDPHERGRRSGVVSSEGGQPAGRNAGGGASLVASAGEEDVHLEARSFARRVADHLAEACREQRFDELMLIAAPRFLGHLRKAFGKQVSTTLAKQLDKDLIHESAAELTARLFPERVAPPGGSGTKAR